MSTALLLDRMAALSDPIRSRVLLLLERHELTVSELCAVLQLPQSTVSRHLKILGDQGWIVSRRDGTSRFYSFAPDITDPQARGLWLLVSEAVGGTPGAGHDERRLKGVLARRRAKSEQFFSSAAGQWDRLRNELFGGRFHLSALPGLVDDRWVVGDLGCGTGQVAETLAPFVRQVVAVDGSDEMLQAARRRLRGLGNVVVRRGDLEALPIQDGELDAATLVLVLHHLPEPAAALAEVARVLRPGGRLLIVDMLPHDRQEYRQQMGHVWLGFSELQISRQLAAAGFESCRFRPLPADADARGPTLFAATATRPAAESTVEALAAPGVTLDA